MKRAATLIELVITIVILASVAMLGTQVVKYTMDFKYKIALNNQLQAQIDSVVAHVASSIRQSIPESVRLRENVLTTTMGNNCLNNGCKYLYNTGSAGIDLITDTKYKALEMAKKMRTLTTPWRSGIDSKCVLDMSKNLDQLNIKGGIRDASCFDQIEDSGASLGPNSNRMIFRCLAMIGAKNKAGKSFKNCNEHLINHVFLNPTKISFKGGRAIYNEAIEYSDYFGVHFRGSFGANTSTFLEKDIYPARIYYANANNITELRNPGSHMELFADTSIKSFSISNAIDIIPSLEIFQLISADDRSKNYKLAPCTSIKCNLLVSRISYEHYIKKGRNNSPWDVYKNLPISNDKEAYLSPFRDEVPFILATGVSRFKVTDVNGVRMINICLSRTLSNRSIFDLGGVDLEVCRSEVI